MQRGPLLQPFRSTERVLSGPPRAHPSGCVQPFRLRRAQPAPARALARQRASMASTFSLVPLHRRSKPTRWAGFPLGVCSAKASLLSQGEAPPQAARFPLRRIRLTPFPQSCHGFVLCRNRASPAFQPISVVVRVTSPVRVPLSLPICAKGFGLFKRAQNAGSAGTPHGLRSKQQPFLAGFTSTRRLQKAPAVAASPFRLPCRGRGMLGIRISPCGDSTPRRYSVPLYRLGAAKFPILGTFSSNPWKITNRHSPMLGAPAARPPYKLGPRALRALLFPDIYREIETP